MRLRPKTSMSPEKSHPLSDLTIGTNKLFVDVSTSKVGINNASPSKDLDVTGEIASSGDLTIGTNKLFVDVSEGKVGINKSVLRQKTSMSPEKSHPLVI